MPTEDRDFLQWLLSDRELYKVEIEKEGTFGVDAASERDALDVALRQLGVKPKAISTMPKIGPETPYCIQERGNPYPFLAWVKKV